MSPSRCAAATTALLALALGGLTACGSQSAEEPHSMSTTSVIENAPTSGIRSNAASAAPESTQDSSPKPQVTDRQTEMASPAGEAVGKQHASKTPEPSGSCGTDSAQSAVDANIGKVKGIVNSSDWSVDSLSTYDPCAALSWVTLSGGGTGSSPRQQMLFHYGDYLGTTTSEAIGFHPATVRLSDSSIQVTYTYNKDGESNAEASGRAVSTYTWNESTQSIDHAGEWPPGIG
ncbi:hypothetical protein KVA01_20640 [Kocuria varians]|uniref:LppP/LprE family lipoprotein n=1 Tax=Kocuria varians TaxID=1272 RepID=A0A4Y4D7G5_KOCVA|nr:LppP/LprE family lipoprotein [Kocuria varians]GEC99909.1 hypothetical protein KVA01_20640 [Kocuria varians]